ncbi:MAG: HPr family phosphocarrier protein [Bacteroidales bacterium]|nr:HPr family phosphocarrier protein [Bacteroidales bacterium]
MIAKKTTIKAPEGLHARPAGELVKLAKSFPGTKTLISNGAREVSAASVLSILSLALKKGTEVEVKAEGPDEESAVNALAGFLDSLEG